jgi:cell division protease FtsH
MKFRNSTIHSSSFIESLTNKKEVEEVIIFGITVAFRLNNKPGWYISERSMYPDKELLLMLNDSNTKFSCTPIQDQTIGIIVLNIILPTALMIWAMKKFILPNVEQPKEEKARTEYFSFQDIGGNDAAKEALLEIADCIKNPMKYKQLGIRIPKGVLLYGPPGTGKTLMAKALANECQMMFFYSWGADFVELYAGLGPKRIRELFNRARAVGKWIIFIDEIDSLGGIRGKGNACKEFDNTLNQLLTEMDGFTGSEGITVIAATNQEDHIDEALLRAGRFDRKIKIELPDDKARLKILKIHLKKRNSIIPDTNLKLIVQETVEFTGADLENVVNEAAFYALRNRNSTLLNPHHLTFEDLIAGLKKVLKEKEDMAKSKLSKQANNLNEHHQLINLLMHPPVANVMNK